MASTIANKTTSPIYFQAPLPPKAVAEIASDLTFLDHCRLERVNKAWRAFLSTYDSPALYLQKFSAEMPADEQLKGTGWKTSESDAWEFPPALKRHADLKRRFLEIRNFSTDVAALLIKDTYTLVAITNGTRIIPSLRDRSWMMLYSYHVPVFRNFWLSLKDCANQQKLYLAMEGTRTRNGHNLQLEHPKSILLSSFILAINALTLYQPSDNPSEVQIGQEEMMIRQLDMPLGFLRDQTFDEIRGLLKTSRGALDTFMQDRVVQLTKLSIRQYCAKPGQEAPPPEKGAEWSRGVLRKRKNELYQCLTELALDLTAQLKKDKHITKPVSNGLEAFLKLPQGPAKQKKYQEVAGEISEKLRNKLWAPILCEQVPSTTTNIPHVLAAGALHITPLLRILREKVDVKKN